MRKGEIVERFDPTFYSATNSLEIAKKTIYPVKKLADVALLQRGKFSHRPRNDERFYHGEYPFIQTGDVVKASLGNEAIQFTQTLNDLGLSVSKLFPPNVLVITIAANIGDTALLTFPACFPDSLVTITPKNSSVDVRYLNVYLKYVKEYLVNLAPQAAQKNINLQQLSPTPVVIPPPETQNKIITIFESAHSSKKQKETEAAALLARIDGYLLEALGITIPPPSTPPTFFYTRATKISGERFDPTFHQMSFLQITEAIKTGQYKANHLKDIVNFSTETWNGKDFFTEVFPYIEISEIDISAGEVRHINHVPVKGAPSRAKMVVRNDDLIVSTTRPSRGAIAHIKQPEDTVSIASTGFAVLRDQKITQVNKQFLLFMLKHKITLAQMEQRSSGGNYPAITSDELGKVLIPLPTLKIQTEIAAHISALRAQAKLLQQQAQAELEAAKKTVEKMILGEA